jgi:hypothetical protein
VYGLRIGSYNKRTNSPARSDIGGAHLDIIQSHAHHPLYVPKFTAYPRCRCPTSESIILADGECILQSALLDALLHLQGKRCLSDPHSCHQQSAMPIGCACRVHGTHLASIPHSWCPHLVQRDGLSEPCCVHMYTSTNGIQVLRACSRYEPSINVHMGSATCV